MNAHRKNNLLRKAVLIAALASGPAMADPFVKGIFIDADGYVGIGTNTPSEYLSVNGTVGIGALSTPNTGNYPLRIKSNGQLAVRIEHQTAGTYWSFGVNTGDFTFAYNGATRGSINMNTGAYNVLSDRNSKQDIAAMGSVLDKVMRLQPVSFRYKDAAPAAPKTIGFIAQDVEQLFPELVGNNMAADGTSYKTLTYSGFGVLAIAALEEQQKTIRQLEADGTALRHALRDVLQELADTRQKIARMENQVSALENTAPGTAKRQVATAR